MGQFQAIITVAGSMILFAYIAFSMSGSENFGTRWIKNLFLMLALLMIPVLVFISHIIADINNLTATASILEKVYGVMIWLYAFLVMYLVIKFIVNLFNLFRIDRERRVEEDVF